MDNTILYNAKFTHHDQSLVEIGQKMWKLVWTDRQTDGQTDRFLYTPQTMFAEGIKMSTL